MQNPTRRRVLAAGLAGTALAVTGRPAVASTPPATTPEETTATTPEETTAEAAPGRPTDADVELLGFAQGLEMSARDLFQLAIDEDADGAEDRVLRAARTMHQANVDTFSALLGRDAPNARDDAFFDDWADQFTTSSLEEAAAAGYDLASILVATYTEALGQLEGIDGARSVAAIVTTESRLCAVFADMTGRGDDFDALFNNDADALSPTSSGG